MAAPVTTVGPNIHRPVQIVSSDENGRLSVTEEAKEILRRYGQDLVIIAIAGKYRTGKSFLLNRLIGRQKAFVLGYTVEACTKGIWMWSELLVANGKYYLLLDTEGLADPYKGVNYDMQIFSLAVLLSSSFVYNNIGVIDERSIQELEVVVELSKHIRHTQQDQKDDDNFFVEFFPDFHWVLRDFMLRLADRSGQPITADKYLENALVAVENARSSHTNNVKQMIRKCFQKRKCHTMPVPVFDPEKLAEIDNMPWEELRPEFRNACDALVRELMTKSDVMKIKKPSVHNSEGGITSVNGRAFVTLTEYYVKCFNDGIAPNFETSFATICERECTFALQTALEAYRLATLRDFKNLPMEIEELYALHTKWNVEAFEAFKSAAKGDKTTFEVYQAKLQNEIVVFDEDSTPRSGIFWQVYRRNYDESASLCEKLTLSILEELALKAESGDFGDVDSFVAATEDAIDSYRKQAKGPCRESHQEKLVREIRHQKELFITRNKIDEVTAQMMHNEQIILEQAAHAETLEKQIVESEKQRKAEMDNLQLQLDQARVKAEEDRVALQKHHDETLAKMQAEHKALLEKNMAQQAAAHQQAIAQLAENNRRDLAALNERNAAAMRAQQAEIAKMSQAADVMRQQVAQAQANAAAAAAAANRGGRRRGGCAIM
eukprot:TRINITY_DN7626_c0_g1_i1.p1 TRINITY_DN7626_c0_g1~~TRINITY_DN7626_c0_g1_i1.p1  ORF type:complete len:662 (-),score=237.71 TRINITY_DN7626_c0_g1_i1:45-2030(-)